MRGVPLMHFAFPADSIECRVGDYIVFARTGMRCEVYRVDDILAIQRLVASAASPLFLIPEDTLLDSMKPAYFGEVQLLLTRFDPVFADASAAREAILQGTLTEHTRGLLRCAGEFPRAVCQVVTP